MPRKATRRAQEPFFFRLAYHLATFGARKGPGPSWEGPDRPGRALWNEKHSHLRTHPGRRGSRAWWVSAGGGVDRAASGELAGWSRSAVRG